MKCPTSWKVIKKECVTFGRLRHHCDRDEGHQGTHNCACGSKLPQKLPYLTERT